MKKRTKLSEAQMREIIAETVRQVLDARERNMLMGMAYPKGVYKRKINDELPHILIDWCLVHYCTITGISLSKEHWKEGLREHLAAVARYAIKRNDAPDKRRKVFNEVWEENDFSMPGNINLTVYNKFYEEGIDVKSDDYATTLIDCISNAQDIFKAILSRNTDAITQYVETI